MTRYCSNCSAAIEPDTNQQYGTDWLDDYCLGLLADRGYLVGQDLIGPKGKMYTLLSFRRNGQLVSYFAPQNFWKERTTSEVKAWLDNLDDSELKPFRTYSRTYRKKEEVGE